jgi:PRTRC genetic system ThiF family protein
MDGDTISPTNCIRQPFSRSEIGLNKVIVLVNRLNLFWGLKWEAIPAHLKPGSHISRSYSGDDLRAHIVVGCVDTRAARAAIRDAVSNWSTVSYWLDLGNNADSGQFIMGEPLNERNRRARLRLRTAAELFNEICDQTLDSDGDPSCSAVEALERQEPFVNATLAQHALALLARLFRYGEISYHGGCPANLSSFFVCMDSLQLGGDGKESSVQALQGALRFLVVELTAIHLQEMARGSKRLPDAGKIGTLDAFGR